MGTLLLKSSRKQNNHIQADEMNAPFYNADSS